MVKRSVDLQLLPSPGLKDAPVLDLMCSHFVLTLAAKQGGKFNVRRDLNGLLSLAGRHLVWPAPALARLREFLARRCKDNEFWRGHEQLSTPEFLERHGVWRGPYEEGTLFFYLDEYAKDQPKDLLSVLAVTGDWLTHALKKHSTLVEKNIDALSGLLQLNKAERALLLYGTLARYQRDLRSILVEFKVNNAPEAYAAIAEIAGVNATEVGEALRAGSRLERIGLVENLISEHNITDLADLMKVSEKLPPVLMREYRDQNELMAVFTRPSAKSSLALQDFSFVEEDAQVLCALLRNAVDAQGAGRERAALRAARHRQDRAGQGRRPGRGAGAVRGGVRRPGRQLAVRARPLPLAADRAGVPQGQRAGGAAVRRGRGRVPADLERGRAADGAGRAGRGAAQQQRERQGLGQPDPGIQRGAHDLGHQPHRADRSGVPPPLRLPPGTEVAAARRARGPGAQDAGGRAGVRRVRRQADRAQGPDAGADPHRGALRRPGQRRRQLDGKPDRAPAAQLRPGAGQPRARHAARAAA